jgi:RNA polymerase sigma-70 factor (ECF subfamily)
LPDQTIALVPIDRRSDEALMVLWVESLRRGAPNQGAFTALYRRYEHAVLRRIEVILGPERRHRDDVAQDTWVALASVSRWESVSFKAWLLTTASRKAIDRCERHDVKKALRAVPGDPDADPLAAAESLAPAPDQVATARVNVALVRRIVDALPEERRRVWMLKYVEECTFEEVAEIEGIPVGTAKTRLRLAAEAVEAELSRRGVRTAELVGGAA